MDFPRRPPRIAYLCSAPLVQRSGSRIVPVDSLDFEREKKRLLSALQQSNRSVHFYEARPATYENILHRLSRGCRVLHYRFLSLLFLSLLFFFLLIHIVLLLSFSLDYSEQCQFFCGSGHGLPHSLGLEQENAEMHELSIDQLRSILNAGGASRGVEVS